MKMKMKMKNWKHCSELRTGHYQPDTELLQQRLHGSCKMEEEEEEEEEEVVVVEEAEEPYEWCRNRV